MMCGRVQLQERTKIGNKAHSPQTSDKPRRFCQKRLVNPQHEEDPRWIDVFDRFHCNDPAGSYTKDELITNYTQEDLFLSVQNLKFQGNEQERKRPRTSFKYKSITDGKAHRMFVKQVVPTVESPEDDCSSQITSYYYDDYAKYLYNNDRSRPSSGKSSIFLQGVATKFQKNKSVQVDFPKQEAKKPLKIELKKPVSKTETTIDNFNSSELPKSEVDETKITFSKSGKRKSLTISRAASPETVQVIRVDVVCNYNTSTSTLSDYDDEKVKNANTSANKKYENINLKTPHFTNKYLLTNTIKTLDENVSGGAKVTLLCKTFRLSDRSKAVFNKKLVDSTKTLNLKH